MPNDTRSGLKTANNRSGGMNPPWSPDLDIIEAVWDHCDRERNKRQPTSKEELWDVLQEAWRTIPEDYLKKLQVSLSKRAQAVLKLPHFIFHAGLNCNDSVFLPWILCFHLYLQH